MRYASHHSRGKRKSSDHSGWRLRIMLAALIISLAGVVGFLVFEYKAHPVWAENLADYRGRLTTWLSERKQSMNKGIARVKSNVIERDDSERVVNFEFYSTLHDMKSMQVEAQAEVKAQKKSAQKSDDALSVRKSLAEGAAAKNDDGAVRHPKNDKQVKISHAADLENDLLAVMQQKDEER